MFYYITNIARDTTSARNLRTNAMQNGADLRQRRSHRMIELYFWLAPTNAPAPTIAPPMIANHAPTAGTIVTFTNSPIAAPKPDVNTIVQINMTTRHTSVAAAPIRANRRNNPILSTRVSRNNTAVTAPAIIVRYANATMPAIFRQ